MRTIIRVTLAALLLAGAGVALAQQHPSEVIAITAEGTTVSATVSGRPGQSPFFLFFDTEGNLLEALPYPYENDRGNAGIAAIDFLKARGIKVIVAASFGSRINEVVASKGMQAIEFTGSARDGVKKAVALLSRSRN